MSEANREPTTAFVAVGSNIDPERNIALALEKLARHTAVRASSTFYRTKPHERPEQPMFINGVWKVLSSLGARELKFDILHKIEKDLGRVRTEDSHAPRTIDLDLILFGDEVIEEPDLVIPDRDIWERSFVAIPLMELAPELKIPGSLKPISSLPAVKSKKDLNPLPQFTEHLKQRLIKWMKKESKN